MISFAVDAVNMRRFGHKAQEILHGKCCLCSQLHSEGAGNSEIAKGIFSFLTARFFNKSN